MSENIIEEINEDLCSLNIKKMFDDVNQALTEGVKPMDIIKNGLIEGIYKASRQVHEGKIFLADIVYVASAVDLCSQMLIGGIKRSTNNKKFKSVVIGTVRGDRHQIGKNIAKYLLRSEGINVLDLGCDVSDDEFAKNSEVKDVGMVICIGTIDSSKKQLKSIVQKIRLYRNDVYIAAEGNAFDYNIVNEARANKYIKTFDEIVENVLEKIEIKEGL